MHDIFLSYSRKDSDTMQKVKQTFKDAGFTVWTDEGIEVGTRSWKRAIQKAILETGCLVCILSPDAVDSRWVQEELDFAELHGKPVFLILARGDERESIPFGYSTHQWVDIRLETNYQTHISNLTKVISRRIKITNSNNKREIPQIQSFSSPARQPKKGVPDKPEKKSSKSKKEDDLKFIKEATVVLNHIKLIMPDPFDWCYIPAGEITLETGGYIPEGGETYHVDAFYMAKYPTTNQQFAEFIAGDGYHTEDYWTNEGWKLCLQNQWTQPRYFHDSNWNRSFHPVIGVTWFEALAFCNWLSLKYENIQILLPTEQQWQRAAQSDDERNFPWGNVPVKSYLNIQGRIGKTTPVTQFSDGASKYGVLDMSGNVWEWCINDWVTGSQELNGDKYRILRGGA